MVVVVVVDVVARIPVRERAQEQREQRSFALDVGYIESWYSRVEVENVDCARVRAGFQRSDFERVLWARLDDAGVSGRLCADHCVAGV